MSDNKLRELERRWKETGSVEDEAAYLLERVRVGELTVERLELAAYCGHEAARFAMGSQAPRAPDDLTEWLRGLQSAPWEVRLALAIESARLAIPVWESMYPEDLRPRHALELAERRLASTSKPTEDQRSALARATEAAEDAAEDHGGSWAPEATAVWAAYACSAAAAFGCEMVADGYLRAVTGSGRALGEDPRPRLFRGELRLAVLQAGPGY